MTSGHADSPTTKQDRSGGSQDTLALVSLGVAFAIAIATAHVYMPLGQNPRVVLFAALDAVFVLYLSVALTVCQRRRALGAGLALAIANGLLAASCAKMVVLGEPGLFADILLVPDLLRVIDPLIAGAGIAVVVLLALAYLGNLRLPRSAREVTLLIPLGVVGAIIVAISHVPMVAHAAAGHIPVKGRGFPVFGHFFTAYSGFASAADWRHTVEGMRAEGATALPFAPLRATPLQSIRPRNLHILVIESLTDPAWYPRYGLENEPLPPLFERWRRAAPSTALSPVFGNRSSNAEFEVLCGVPAAVSPSDVVFWRLPERLPCLPRRLAALGYRTIALHPSPRRTFNLSEAYPALGFEQSAFAGDLDFSDRDGQFLSARATLDQHWQRIEPLLAGDHSVLSYAFVNASHFPYQLDERRRPGRWRPDNASPLTTRYLNAIHYMTVAIDRFVAQVLQADPDSLIVILGDHEPALGPNFEGQRAGGRVAVDDPDPLGRAEMYEVPLILLDRGEMVPLGRLPTYLLPYALMERLGACGERGCADDPPWRLRPFRDRAILVERDGSGQRSCLVREPTPPCDAAAQQAHAWQVELLELIEGQPPARLAETAGH